MRQSRNVAALVVILAVAALVVLSACGQLFSPTNVHVNTPPSPAASPSPAPSPTPGPVSQGSFDVDHVAIFSYGQTCSQGSVIHNNLNGAPSEIPADCTEVLLTATPKRKDGADSTNHGRALRWTLNGVVSPDNSPVSVSGANVLPGPVESTFNRTIQLPALGIGGRPTPGTLLVLSAVLSDPSGQPLPAATFSAVVK